MQPIKQCTFFKLKDAFIKPLPSELREECRRGGRVSIVPERTEDAKGTVSSRHNMTDTHMNSQRLW